MVKSTIVRLQNSNHGLSMRSSFPHKSTYIEKETAHRSLTTPERILEGITRKNSDFINTLLRSSEVPSRKGVEWCPLPSKQQALPVHIKCKRACKIKFLNYQFCLVQR